MKITTLADLYLDLLQDSHNSERQIIKALPKMIKAATHPRLKSALGKHLEETKEQLERLNAILTGLDKGPGRTVCEATVGLVKEGARIIEDSENGDVLDAGLICAAQKVEHYEIASYGSLRTLAQMLGRGADVKLLDRTLNEEKKADAALTELAMTAINADAMA